MRSVATASVGSAARNSRAVSSESRPKRVRYQGAPAATKNRLGSARSASRSAFRSATDRATSRSSAGGAPTSDGVRSGGAVQATKGPASSNASSCQDAVALPRASTVSRQSADIYRYMNFHLMPEFKV